jgi:hypothetical protein
VLHGPASATLAEKTIATQVEKRMFPVFMTRSPSVETLLTGLENGCSWLNLARMRLNVAGALAAGRPALARHRTRNV